MLRRLFVPYSLLFLVLIQAFGAAAIVLADAPETRRACALLTLAVAIFGLAGCFLLSLRTARRLVKPLRELIGEVEALTAGNPARRVFSDRSDEIDELGRAITLTSERLSARIARLEEERQQLRTILSGMVEGVVALDAEQRILYANDRAAELLELPVPPPVGRRLWEVVRQRRLLDVVRQAIEQAEPTREEIVWNGAARSLTVHAARLPGDPPRGAVLVLHDTTELRRLERLRRDFAANASHELKTPLSVIKVCVETLLDGAVDDPVHRVPFLQRIAQQSDRLHSLILDLLSLARIESGNELFEFQAVALAPVVRACLERFRARAEARGQHLTAGGAGPAAEDASALAWADEEALDHLLDNLVDNALKYTADEGKIALRWRAFGEEVQLEVSDTGIGIPESDLPRIFERFYRVDKARSRELGGTGLGLSIVKHLAQCMRGGVSATSRVGEGTTFLVSLPRAHAPGPSFPDKALLQYTNSRVSRGPRESTPGSSLEAQESR